MTTKTDIPSFLQIPSGKPPSSTSISSSVLLSDIIDELQLAATTTAQFLSDMEAHLQGYHLDITRYIYLHAKCNYTMQ